MWRICLFPPAALLPSVSSVNKKLATEPLSAMWLKMAPKEGLVSSVNAASTEKSHLRSMYVSQTASFNHKAEEGCLWEKKIQLQNIILWGERFALVLCAYLC